MKKFLIIFFLISTQVSSQNITHKQEIDSILNYLNTPRPKGKISPYLKAISLSKKIKNDTLLRKSLIKLGLNGYYRGDTSIVKKANKSLKALYINNKDSLALAKIYHLKALKFRLQNQLDSSYYYYDRSKDISILLKDSLAVSIRLKSMAEMQNNEKDYIGAQVTAVESLEYIEPLDNILYKLEIYNILGNILINIKEYEEARIYYSKARRTLTESSDKSINEEWNLLILNNEGYSYYVEEKYDEALRFFEEGISFSDIENKYINIYILLLGNLAASKYKLGKKEEAWIDFNKLYSLSEKQNNAYLMSRIHNNFAENYVEEGKKQKALFHAKKGYQLAQEGNNNYIAQEILRKLVQLTTGKESRNYFKEYISLRDMLYDKEVAQKEQFALVRYETEEKEKENVGLKLENSQKQAEIESEKLQKIIFALIGILMLVISITYFRNRRKKLEYEAQIQKATAREEERQQIAKSLHDEVAGDLRMLHQKLEKTDLGEETKSIEKIKENVRNLSHQLSSVDFDEVSFKDQILNLVSDYFTPSFRISVEGVHDVPWSEINSTIKRTLYLCTRESLQNTLKYAEASQFVISFSTEKKQLVLHVKDNGKGFDESFQKKGIGLKNLKERVEEIGGTFDIETNEKGTGTAVRIPINGG